MKQSVTVTQLYTSALTSESRWLAMVAQDLRRFHRPNWCTVYFCPEWQRYVQTIASSRVAHSRQDCLIGTTSILARVGVSFISSEQACANAEEEIPDFDFERVRSASRAQWNELLGRVQVDTSNVDPEIVDLFYSSFYRTHLSPADCAKSSPNSVVVSLTDS